MVTHIMAEHRAVQATRHHLEATVCRPHHKVVQAGMGCPHPVLPINARPRLRPA